VRRKKRDEQGIIIPDSEGDGGIPVFVADLPGQLLIKVTKVICLVVL
jgi:hypothetical protein